MSVAEHCHDYYRHPACKYSADRNERLSICESVVRTANSECILLLKLGRSWRSCHGAYNHDDGEIYFQ